MINVPPYIVLEKAVGETPLSCMEAWRATQPALAGVPLAYAGRLDPMASGKLLVLIGDTCKRQAEYHGLDKEYEFSVLLGVSSDSGDVLGIVRSAQSANNTFDEASLARVADSLRGDITLPYPHFSARTVAGKPLHTWAVEGRLAEISVPEKQSTIYSLIYTSLTTLTRAQVYEAATAKIELIPPVTDPRKAIGNDFRRPEVRAAWQRFRDSGASNDPFMIPHFLCSASSGTYMRSLSEEIARQLGTTGLAWSIHRTRIGTYVSESATWNKLY